MLKLNLPFRIEDADDKVSLLLLFLDFLTSNGFDSNKWLFGDDKLNVLIGMFELTIEKN